MCIRDRVNSSRSIIYASQEKNFADKAASEAIKLQGKMKIILTQEK